MSMIESPSNVGRDRVGWRQALSRGAESMLPFAILFALAVAYCVLFRSRLGHLPGSYEWTSIVDTSLPLVFAGLAQAVIVITGGLDLSIAGMMDISNGVAAMKLGHSPGSMLFWSVVIVAIGAFGGLVNGLLVTRGRMAPILVTLATLAIFQGVALFLLPQPGGSVPSGYTDVLTNPSTPYGLIWIGAAIVLWFFFRRTRLGIDIFAVGSDPIAARSRGVRTQSVTVRAYMLSGCLAATAGLFLAATSTSGDPTAGDAFVLTSIVAVVVGGIAIGGGRGNPVGVVAAALALTVLVDVLFFANVSSLYVYLYEGLFLIVAVVLAAGLKRIWKASDGRH